MSLNWYGNSDWNDDRPPTYPVSVLCTKCNEKLIWWKPVMYDGNPPKHECGGIVKLAE